MWQNQQRLIPQPKSSEACQRLYVVNISCRWVINITIFVILFFLKQWFCKISHKHTFGGWALLENCFPQILRISQIWIKASWVYVVCVVDQVNKHKKKKRDWQMTVSVKYGQFGATPTHKSLPWEILLVFQPGPQFQRVRLDDSLKW